MAFNKEKFIADAKAAGYGDDEINAELAASSSESSGFDQKDSGNSGWDSGRPALATTPGAIAAAIPQAGSRVEAETKRLEQKRTEKEQQAPVIPEFVQNPLMLGGAAAAGGAAVIGYKTLRDKMANSASQPMAGAERREPSLFGAQRLDEPTWSASDPQTAPLSQEEMMNRLRGLAGETSAVNEPGFAQVPQAAAPAAPQGPNLTLAEAQARMAGVTPPVVPTAVPAVVPEAVAPAMVEAPKPIAPSAAPNSAATKAVTETIQQLGQAEGSVTAQRRNLAQMANNPTGLTGQPDMRVNYDKPKGINPETGKPFIGSGSYNWLAGQEGPKAPEVYKNLVGEKNIPYAEFMEKIKPAYEGYTGSYGDPDPFNQVAKPGSYKSPALIPKYIKGAASPSALASTAVLAALPALAVAGYQKYKGNETAVNSSLQEAKDSLLSLATMPVDVAKATLKGDFRPLKDLMMSMNPGSLLFNEIDKNDEAILKKIIQKEKVGAGRGLQGVAPPTR